MYQHVAKTNSADEPDPEPTPAPDPEPAPAADPEPAPAADPEAAPAPREVPPPPVREVPPPPPVPAAAASAQEEENADEDEDGGEKYVLVAPAPTPIESLKSMCEGCVAVEDIRGGMALLETVLVYALVFTCILLLLLLLLKQQAEARELRRDQGAVGAKAAQLSPRGHALLGERLRRRGAHDSGPLFSPQSSPRRLTSSGTGYAMTPRGGSTMFSPHRESRARAVGPVTPDSVVVELLQEVMTALTGDESGDARYGCVSSLPCGAAPPAPGLTRG